MEKWKIEANEKWLDNIISLLNEGGGWGWKETGFNYTKKEGKLSCTAQGYEAVSQIVSKEYLTKNFWKPDTGEKKQPKTKLL